MSIEPLVEVKGLKKYFPLRDGLFGRTTGQLKAVDDVSFSIRKGRIFGLVGESGSGKTTVGRTLLGLHDKTAGEVMFKGQALDSLSKEALRALRPKMQLVFQDPYSSMNPRLRIADFVGEPMLLNARVSTSERLERSRLALEQVGLSPDDLNNFPHEFSGGQRQRLAIARDIASNPRVIVLDEPVSSLDVSIRAQIMNLLKSLQETQGYSYLFIAHHLGTVRYMSHMVGVMYLGRMMELSESEELFTRPLHPYTQALFSAALPDHPDIERNPVMLTNDVAAPTDVPRGCRLHTRCPFAKPVCAEVEPPWKEVGPRHWSACHLH